MVRNFSLVNEIGEEYSFMDIYNFCLLTDPSGLGYSYSNNYEKVGEMFILTLISQKQETISGVCNFLLYDNYTNFINFIESSSELKLKYIVPYAKKAPVEYFKDVAVNSIGKTEKSLDGVLKCEIRIDMLSLWYEKKQYVYNMGKTDNEVRWDFRWTSRFMSYNSRNLVFNNQGHTSAPLTILVDGPLKNPIISVENNLGKEVFRLEIPIELVKYESFFYSSVDGKIEISKKNIDGTTESLFKQQYINIENNNIFKLPQGISRINLSADKDITSAEINIYPYYRSV